MFPFFSAEYPENWDEIRKEVYCRDGWQCQKCGAKNILDKAQLFIEKTKEILSV